MNGSGAAGAHQAPASASPRSLESWLALLPGAACCLAPPLLCLILYRYGLLAWFQADDFAWLSLPRDIHSGNHAVRDLAHALFAPMAQGTIRPWSERGFFLLFETLFGVNALPFRVWVFLTQCANLTLLAAVTRRITGSRAAGLWAAILWLANFGLALPMVWTSAYNQVLSSFFLLGAFWFLLRYIETGRASHNLAQWAMFVAGFGALETNVVYPAVAALYTFLCARKYFRSTLPLFAPSAVFAAIHLAVAPLRTTGDYALHFDLALPGTFWTYWEWALAADPTLTRWPMWLKPVFIAASTTALTGFAIVRARRQDWLPVFGLSWFVLLLAPVMPLRDHVSAYYLVAPAAGLAMAGGHALARALRGPIVWKTAAAVLVAVYAWAMIYSDRRATRWWYDRSIAIERMVLGVARARQLHPDKVILLDGVDGSLFWAGVFHQPFLVLGVFDVYLTPGSEQYIEPRPGLGRVTDYVLPSEPALKGLHNGVVVVYAITPGRLRNITSLYEARLAGQAKGETPRRVDVGNPLMAYLLGTEWYSLEGGYRWIPSRATLRIGGPRSPAEKLYVTGFCPEAHLRMGPLPIRLMLDGVPLKTTVVTPGEVAFQRVFDLPNQFVGKEQVTLAVEAGRTIKMGLEQRDRALAFGVFEIR